jgi:hypothetical protein
VTWVRVGATEHRRSAQRTSSQVGTATTTITTRVAIGMAMAAVWCRSSHSACGVESPQ